MNISELYPTFLHENEDLFIHNNNKSSFSVEMWGIAHKYLPYVDLKRSCMNKFSFSCRNVGYSSEIFT